MMFEMAGQFDAIAFIYTFLSWLIKHQCTYHSNLGLQCATFILQSYVNLVVSDITSCGVEITSMNQLFYFLPSFRFIIIAGNPVA
jgi:hypothetical protein